MTMTNFDEVYLRRASKIRLASGTPTVDTLPYVATFSKNLESLGYTLSGDALSARHDPARVLAECAAKRAIIGPVTEDEVTQWEIWSRSRKRTIPADQIGHWDHGTGPTLDILRILAAVYGDHPDYQQEWAL